MKLALQDYKDLQKEISNNLPKTITDCHIHTATWMPEIPEETKKFHPLSHFCLSNRKMNVRKDSFKRFFPNKQINLLGFPLPVPARFKNPSIQEWNKEVINQKKQNLLQGCLIHLDTNENIKNTINYAKKNNTKINGVKIHPRIATWKPKKEVLVIDLVTDSFLELAEKNNFSLNLEVSHGLCDEDIKKIKEIDDTYKINMIIPHCSLNYRSWVMSYQDYKTTLNNNTKEFEKEFNILKNTSNVFMDTAMVLDQRAIAAALSVLGEDKIIWGSDYPFCFTPKIKELRPDNEIVGQALQNILDGKYNEIQDLWKYDYSHLIMMQATINGMKTAKLDCAEKLFNKNCKKGFNI